MCLPDYFIRGSLRTDQIRTANPPTKSRSIYSSMQGRLQSVELWLFRFGFVRGRPNPVNNLISRSVSAPKVSPAATSLVQCARRRILVSTRPTPAAQIALRCFVGKTLAADASAPMCTACPEGNASSRFPEIGIPCRWPAMVKRSGRSWSKMDFRRWGNADATSVVMRTWSLSRREFGPFDRQYSHQQAASAQRTYSSAPQVSASAVCSARGPVWDAISPAMTTSASVGFTLNNAIDAHRSPIRNAP